MSKEKKMIKFIFEQHSRMSCIFRFGTVPKVVPQSIAEHSYCVTFFAMLVADYLIDRGVKLDKLRLLEMGLIHDVEEIFTDDILNPLKRGQFKEELDKLNVGNMAEVVRFLETRKEEKFSMWKEAKEKKTFESLILAFCDRIDRFVYCVSEIHLGNNYFRDILEVVVRELQEWATCLPQLQEVVYEVTSYATAYLAGNEDIITALNKGVKIYSYEVDK